jgi:hypothetical protein
MKTPLLRSEELLTRVKEALTPNRLPLLIVIDGADNSGKSSLASWLAWQLGMPAVQLDLYLTDLHPMRWLTAELARVVKHRIDNGRPVILDGVCALDVVDHGVSDSSAKTLLVARSTNTRAVSLPRSNTDFTRADRTMSRSALTTAFSPRARRLASNSARLNFTLWPHNLHALVESCGHNRLGT